VQYICLHKEIVLQNALRYNFVLLSPAIFSAFDGENSPPFLNKTFWQEDNFLIFMRDWEQLSLWPHAMKTLLS